MSRHFGGKQSNAWIAYNGCIRHSNTEIVFLWILPRLELEDDIMCSLDGQLKCTVEQIVDGWLPCFDCYIDRRSPAFLCACIWPLAMIGDRMRRNRKLSQCFDVLPFYPECLRWRA